MEQAMLQMQIAALQAMLGSLGSQFNEFSQSADDSQGQVEAVQTLLANIGLELAQISSDLDDAVTDSVRETIDKLEIAMTKDYKIAVFIRGDYDDREVDEERKKEVLHQAVLAFQDVQERAEAGLKKIADFHAQVVEVQNTQIAPAKDTIKLMIEQNEIELDSVKRQLSEAQQAIETMQTSLTTQSQAVESLQSKIEQSEAASIVSDIGFSILTFGIGNLINDGPLDPFNLHGELDDARRLRDDAQSSLNNANTELAKLTVKQLGLNFRLATQSQIQASLPQLQSTASTTESRCIMLQSQFGLLKDTSSKLLLKVEEVQNGAVIVENTAFTKKEFAEALLEMCSDALIDSRLIDEVQMIKGEIFNEWGGDVPAEIYEAGEMINGKIELLADIPSIKDRL